MSSIEPNFCGCEVDCAEEISGGLVIARGDGTELFEFAEEIFDQVACFVELRVELAGRCSVFLGRDHAGLSGGGQRPEDAIVGILGLVGDRQVGGHLRMQGIGSGQIVNLSGGQQEAQRVAEGVDQGMDLDAQPALAATHRLIVIFFGCAGAVLVGPHDDAVDHGVFVVGVTGEVLKQALPYPLLGPAAEPPVGVLPVPELLREVAPRNSGAVSVENGFDELAIISDSDTDIAGFSGKQVPDSLAPIGHFEVDIGS